MTDTIKSNAAALLDAFYCGVPEKFANEARTAGVAAAIPLCDDDRMWLRGIRAAIAVSGDADTLHQIAAMMSEFVDNWPNPKKLETALALVAKTIRAALAGHGDAK